MSTNLFNMIFFATVASLGGFLFGYDSGVINGAISAIQSEFNTDALQTGFNVSSMIIGTIIGSFSSGYFADKFGRKNIMFLMCFFFIISAWGSGIATSSAEFVIYRIIGGFAVGAASAICPAYVCEISPSAIRGRVASIQPTATILGMVAAYFVNYYISASAGGSSAVWLMGYEAWQWMFWAEIAPVVLFLMGLVFIPESPRYLVSKGRDDKAFATLKKIACEDPVSELAEIKLSFTNKKLSCKDIFKAGTFIPHQIIIVGAILALFQQLTGINVILYYGEVLWQSIGFDESTALEQNVIMGIVNMTFAFVAIYLIDKVGRKSLLIVGGLCMAISLSIMSICFMFGEVNALGEFTLDKTYGIIAFVCAMIYLAGFFATWGPVVWVSLGEMFPNHLRASGLAIATGSIWTSNYFITLLFPVSLKHIGLPITYGFFAICGFISVVFVKKYLRENKGVKLEDM